MNTLEKILNNVNKPYQYVGNEMQSVNKNWSDSDVKLALVFPDKYEIGASNLGQKILYSLVNQQENLFADRAYAPDLDFIAELNKNDVELYGLNSKKSLRDFDFVGFSLQYELAYPTVLKLLEMAKIPVKREERDENYPIILAGGPSTFNPIPMSDFIDVFQIGDGEETTVQIMQMYLKLKNQGLSKKEILHELSKIQGLFIPELYNYRKLPITPKYENVPEKVKKAMVQLNAENFPELYPVAYSTSIHDRATLEIRRGCGRMCRFCQPGHVTLPVRERKAADIIAATKELVKKTGYDEYSLLSLSSNDYTNIESVIEELSCTFSSKGISASLPSQRVDKFSVKLANLVQEIRKSTLTLAPEAGSQRMRNVINKNLTKEQIISASLQAYENGFHQLKFYFIIGLPTETYEDLDELISLLSEIKNAANNLKREKNIPQSLTLTCTLSIFVPKPFTPFQWFAQTDLEEIMNRIHYLKEKAKILKGVKLNYHDKAISQIEAVFSRGGYELNDYIYALYKKGAYLDGWDENFNYSMWRSTAEALGISLEQLAQKVYELDEPLSWDVIDVGVNKEWLQNEYRQALISQVSVPCEVKCTNCGVCRSFNTKKVVDSSYSPNLTHKKVFNETTYKYRIKLSKMGYLKYLSHLDWQNTLLKALYKTDLNLVFSQGFNPIPKISLGVALPLFVESECELVDIELYDDLEETELKKIIQQKLPENSIISKITKIDKKALSIDNTTQWAMYEFRQIDTNIVEPLHKKENLLYIKRVVSSDDEIFIKKKNKKGIEKNINIKNSIKMIEIVDVKVEKDHFGEKTKRNSKESEQAGNTSESVLRVVLKTGQNSDIPSIRPDALIKYFYPDTFFKIKKIRMYDFDFNEL